VPSKHQRKWFLNLGDLDFDFMMRAASISSVIHYVNAKVVLVGESGVGKSGLGIRLAEREFRLTNSTHGAQFWQIDVPGSIAKDARLPNLRAELTLWDLAGQTDYHLVHQLFLDNTSVALLLFDCSDAAEPFSGVSYWAKVLNKQAPNYAVKLLISARCDVSPVTVSQREINNVLAIHGLDGYLRTCAKTGEGIKDLMSLILNSVPWSKLPRTSTPRLFQIIRKFLLEQKEAGHAIISEKDIFDKFQTKQIRPTGEVNTVIDQLQARGILYRLSPTPNVALILLKPELINQYASSIIRAARDHARGIGAVTEHDVVCANLPFSGIERLEPEKEKVVLESTAELFIRHDLCFREMGMLVFPSQLNLARPAFGNEHPPSEVTYEFSGSLEATYASLVVRLSYTEYFKREDQWRYAAEFSRNGHRLGFAMDRLNESTGLLEIYFYPGVDDFDRVTFIRFITDHLHAKGIDIIERIRLYCPQCRKEVKDRDAIEARVSSGALDIPCQYCRSSIIIPRSIEERYRSNHFYQDKQQELTRRVQKRTNEELRAFTHDRRSYTKADEDKLYILHLSDIHIRSIQQAEIFRVQLEADLTKELNVNRLGYLIISGDIANQATKEEYEAAFQFADGIVKRFGLDPERVVVVPGNHDLNWDASAQAYAYVPKHSLPSTLLEGQYISVMDGGVLLRDELRYEQRFENFNKFFFSKVYAGISYPTDYADQGLLYACENDRIVFLALNSSWEVDHYHNERAGINATALARALTKLTDNKFDEWLKIAVWHHPVTGHQGMNCDFLQQLAVHGFQCCLHGHVHEANDGRARVKSCGNSFSASSLV
jgi:small GTP-binding protein